MFDRFVRLAQAGRALAAGRPEEALRLADDPLVAVHRRGVELRARALAALLDRARSRLRGGDPSGALADVRAVLSRQPEHASAADLLALAEREVRAQQTRRALAIEELTAARALMDGGELDAATARVAALEVPQELAGDRDALVRAIAARRAAAASLASAADGAVERGKPDDARELLRQAKAISAHVEVDGKTVREVVNAAQDAVERDVRRCLTAGDLDGAFLRLEHELVTAPDSTDHPRFHALRRQVRAAFGEAVAAELRAGRLREAVARFRGCAARVEASPGEMDDLIAGLGYLQSGIAAHDLGDFAGATVALGHAARVLDCAAVTDLHRQVRAEHDAIVDVLRNVRDAVAEGDLVAARQLLERALVRSPFARALLDELRVLEDGVADRQRRIAAVRELAAAGRLREACAQALALASPGANGDDARALRAELQSRMDIVSAGVDQVRRAAHGRGSDSPEGLAHCIARLDELAKVQVDHEDLPRLRQALAEEKRGLELIRRLLDDLHARGPKTGDVDVVRDLVAQRGRLLSMERLDARLLEVVDTWCALGVREVEAGRLAAARVCLEALTALQTAMSGIEVRVDELRAAVARAQADAMTAVDQARAALSARDFVAAESCLERARRCDRESPDVRGLEAELGALRRQLQAIDEVTAMTDRRDFARAHERLATMPPTAAALRTKIFDLKRSLAHAQGLDAGFMLRVDEGGEFLVLRRDSVSIGNLRDGRADLVVLANIAGQHARVSRRISFHGGMEDRVAAERGEVRVNGAVVREQRLRDGDRIDLSGQLGLLYRVPSSRSLTVSLRLLGGFQVHGTDRVLLLKDRGRDGRIIIGNSRDAHVPVATAGAEVEVFAGNDGQVRVHYQANGTIDGKPFQGEHPVPAGVVVACGDVSFVLSPLAPH